MPVDMNKAEPPPRRHVELDKSSPGGDKTWQPGAAPPAPNWPPAPGAPFEQQAPAHQRVPHTGLQDAPPAPWPSPYLPGPHQQTPYGPAGFEAPARRSSSKVMWLVVAGLVAAVLAGLLVGVAMRGSSDPSRTQNLAVGPPAPSTLVPASSTAQATSDAGTARQTPSSQPASSPVVPPPTTRAPSDLVGPTERYSAPGGLTVDGPAGWRLDRSAGVPDIRDYVDPSSPERLAGGAFRIGIGNATPNGSFTDEVADAANFLRTSHDADIRRIAFTTFLGAPAADVEYSYVLDGRAVARHGVERLCRRDGHTLIVQASDLSRRWARTQAIFARLVATASVS